MRSVAAIVWGIAVLLQLSSASSAAAPNAGALAARVDEQIDARLSKESVKPAETADDAEFLRRAYLDLHGVVPTRDQAKQFLADTNPDKRARLIDELLASPRYGQYMGDMWQAYLMSPLADDRHPRATKLRGWLAEQFNTRTWDRIASDLLTATGKMEDNPATCYLIEGRLPRTVPDLTDIATRYFLGVRLNCAQCHDHKTVKWTQEDYWGVAAFFAQIQTPRRAKQVYELGVIDDAKVSLSTLKDSDAIDGFTLRPPTFLGGQEMSASKTTNRAAFAQWMTSPQNPYFARAMANRTWWRLFGHGIVDPVDDMHEANLPSHPELLDLLAQQFTESGYDLKLLTRSIMLSRAYQRTSRPGEADQKQVALFGRMSIKPLSAGQLYDSLETIFGSPEKTRGIDLRQIKSRDEFTEFFGETGDPNPVEYRRGIPHMLRQMNSGQFAGRNLDALVGSVSTSQRPPAEIANDLFLTILSRPATADEQKRFEAYVQKAGSAQNACRELAWVLMMTSEFALNH